MRTLLCSLVAVLAAGCKIGQPDIVTQTDAKLLFDENCARCHGSNGTGDGIAGASLVVPPADLTKIAARRGGVWPMLEVMSIIDGYAQTVSPREGMPVISEITDGPVLDFDTGNGTITEVPARLVAVTEYLEGLQSPPPDRYVP